jgi:N utilization substance protein B
VSGARRQARAAALQALYAWEVGHTPPAEALDAVLRAHYPDAGVETRDRAANLVQGTVAALADLDRTIDAHSQHWRVARLAIIDRLILRMAIWELQQPQPTPRPVVLNEAIELARRFSSEDAVKFVNGVLDAVGRTIDAGHRPAESGDSQPHGQ